MFVYGTLTDPERVAELLDRYDLGPAATLHGLHRTEGRYPTLVPGGKCEGRLLETHEIDRLDAYEGVDSGLYTRVSIPVSDGTNADCYVGDPDRLDVDAEWPGTGSFAERVRSYLAAHEVEIGHKG
ncbi:gamma-glutamylcyclotransferase family protein [Halalkalicoccus jeotgali]|uniref:AIG2 family protein n=1 Tax=Halalkalicoccus jeotgali (strain DSM 18796 / CECT 7217 / JCM 14584 / KCTC 4019 / B3) TaxID=795797 RepID=D8J5C0_HALJB|nr:AIG2 family protein [Halalkalicoccus jeotgali B3]ELY34252.1 AIG2 family protein [Halalkalicoccus jeotgali B3]